MGAEALRVGRWRAALLVVLGALAWQPALALELPEYRLKAAFLYNFAVFTEWPAGVGPTLNLCLHGGDPFGAEIDGLQGKEVSARRIAVQRAPGAEALKACHVVFVAAPAAEKLPRLSEQLQGLPVLVVADSAGAARQGAALNMSVVQGRVTFQANPAAARNAGLTLSSKLLRLASEVVP